MKMKETEKHRDGNKGKKIETKDSKRSKRLQCLPDVRPARVNRSIARSYIIIVVVREKKIKTPPPLSPLSLFPGPG